MGQTVDSMEGKQSKAVDVDHTPSNSAQSIPDSESDCQIHVPPSILRLKAMGISTFKTDAEDPEQSHRDDNTLDEVKAPEGGRKCGQEEQSHRECDEDLFPTEYGVTLQYVRDNVPAFCELADLRLKVFFTSSMIIKTPLALRWAVVLPIRNADF